MFIPSQLTRYKKRNSISPVNEGGGDAMLRAKKTCGLLLASLILSVGTLAVPTNGRADGPIGSPHPPTDPSIAIELGVFGLVLPRQTLFHSTYDSGKIYVGTQFYPRQWFKFSTGSGEADTMQFRRWTAASGALYKVYDQNLQFVGNLNDPGLQISKTKQYYIEVSADHQTWAHFAFEIRPAVDAFQNDGGSSEQNATDLGTLTNVLNHRHPFYTYYTRGEPDLFGSSETPGVLTPNFQAPDPGVSRAYYSFNLPRPSTIQVFTFNQDGDTYIIRKRGTSDWTVVQNGATFDLTSAGTYTLEIVDKHTTVSGNVEARDSRIENYENQSFELLVKNAQNAPPTNPPSQPGAPEVSPLGPPPNPSCVIIGNQRIGC